ncbi:MAG: DUF885 family protein [Vicinamibacteria bacterium]|nr:DUF885 family protein [Vicinamibacteria bacterium]
MIPCRFPLFARAVSAALVLALAAPAFAQTPAAAAARFKALYDREWSWRQAQSAGLDEDADRSLAVRDRFPRVDAATQAERLRYWTEVLTQLKSITVADLSAEDQVNYAIYAAQVEALEASTRFRDYEKPFNSDSSFWAEATGAAQRPLRNLGDYQGYLRLLEDLPRYFAEHTVNMRAGLARGFSVPRVTLTGRDASIAVVAEAKDPETNPFFAPLRKMPTSVGAAEQAELRAAAKRVIREAVIPAYTDLLAFMRNEYMVKARVALDAGSFPDGAAYYQSKIREFTTLDLTPDAIHRIGVAEVAKIRAEMEETMKKTDFMGDFPAFLKFLRTDPRFYAKTGEELLMRAAWISKRVDGKLSDLFGTLPRARFTIIPVPDDIAPFYTSGRGGPGVYLVNTYNLPARPLYNLPALTLHESAPGHAMQMSLAAEHKEQPEFRQRVYISAYGEGWALYTEKLGVPMGIYETPYEHFGMLTYQMWRAARLVVDTGIHTKGWTRDQALAFLRDNTALAEHEITTEIDRYIAWPGQALSYYLGQMQIEKSRAQAEAALGAKFDLRAFHDTVLSLGSVTLPQLEARINRFIAEGGKGPDHP